MFGNCSHKSLIGEAGLTDILNSDIIDGGSAGDTVVYVVDARIFSVADNMLPVKVFMSILYSTVIKSQVQEKIRNKP